MKSKAMASRQYTANQFGMSNGGPKRPKKNGGGKSDDSVEVCTAETAKEGKCGAFAGGGPSMGNVQKSNYKKPSSTSRGGKNVVLKPGSRKAERHARSLAKVRENAPAMKNMTKKQKQSANEMRPSRQDMSAPKASARPAAQPKKTKKITF